MVPGAWQEFLSLFRKGQPALGMVSYHTTHELLSLVTAMNCPGVTYHTAVRNQTDDGKDLTVVMVGADSPQKSSAKDKLRIMMTFGIHGREYFASEVALKYAPRETHFHRMSCVPYGLPSPASAVATVATCVNAAGTSRRFVMVRRAQRSSWRRPPLRSCP